MKCNDCGKEINDISSYCPYCGTKPNKPEELFCSKCHEKLSPDMFSCPNCGSPVHQHTSQNSLEGLNKRIVLYKRLLKISPILFFVVLIISPSIWIDIIGIAFLLGIDTFLDIKIAKLNRNKDSLKYNFCNAEGKRIPFDQTKIIDNLNNKEDKEISSYLFLENVCSTITTIGLVLFGSLLLFVPFFSVIIDDISVYNLAESSLVWNLNLFSDKEFLYTDILADILQEGFITNFLYKQGDLFGFSFMFFFIIPVCSAVGLGRNICNLCKYKTDISFKNAILYRYNNQATTSYIFGSLLLLVVLVGLFLPTLDFLFYLPTYFTETLTNFGYFIVLVGYLLFLVFLFIYPIALQKKYKQAMFALKPVKR